MDQIHTPSELEILLGDNIKALRLQKNISRQVLSDQAGISQNALRHLEGGQGATLKTLVCVLKALGRESWLLGLAPAITINPLHMLRAKSSRQRASRRKRHVEE